MSDKFRKPVTYHLSRCTLYNDVSLPFLTATFLNQSAFGFVVIGKFLLVAFEGGGVVVAAAVDVFGRVVDVEHFVKDDVFDDVSRHIDGVKRPADGDVVVRCVVVAEDAVGFLGRPRQHRFWDRVAKILPVNGGKYLVEIVDCRL